MLVLVLNRRSVGIDGRWWTRSSNSSGICELFLSRFDQGRPFLDICMVVVPVVPILAGAQKGKMAWRRRRDLHHCECMYGVALCCVVLRAF